MMEILHSFGIGIAFALGILTGGTLSTLIAKYAIKGSRKDAINYSEHYRITEERLGRSADAHERIADCLERLGSEYINR